jgi:hypothetical protein
MVATAAKQNEITPSGNSKEEKTMLGKLSSFFDSAN